MHEFQEYPKWVQTEGADGVVVWNKEEEEMVTGKKEAEEPKKRGRPRKEQ